MNILQALKWFLKLKRRSRKIAQKDTWTEGLSRLTKASLSRLTFEIIAVGKVFMPVLGPYLSYTLPNG